MTPNTGSVSAKAGYLSRAYNLIKPALFHLKNSAGVLLALGVIVLLVIVWWLGPKWSLGDEYPLAPVTVRWMITLGVGLFVALVVVFLSRSKLNKLEQARAKAERDREDPAQPILDAQERRFNHMLVELRESTMVRNYLYVLPWYMVLGAEGSGKTSLINRSNQNYNQTAYSNAKRRHDIEPPYKIDWWIGNDALLIDPDGDGPMTASLARSGDHSWFVVLVGPAGQGPKYAIAVVMEYAGSGGKVSGPICNQIIHALRAEGYL